MHAEHADNSELNELSGRVIGCAFSVINTLGAGFLERVYENALAYEVRAAGLSAVQQYGAKVHYKDFLVGEYFLDLMVDDVLLVELKTVKALDDAHRMQCTNYLKATGLLLCLLLNFGNPRLDQFVEIAGHRLRTSVDDLARLPLRQQHAFRIHDADPHVGGGGAHRAGVAQLVFGPEERRPPPSRAPRRSFARGSTPARGSRTA